LNQELVCAKSNNAARSSRKLREAQIGLQDRVAQRSQELDARQPGPE
jgi:hypothetical protein